MNMPRIIFTFAVIFVLLGIGAYLITGAQSWTALIPSIFGLLLAIAGGISLKSLKHGGHIAALVGLLGFLGTAKSLGKLPALLKGEVVERAAAVGVQASFAILSLIFVALCVKSFIDARKQQQQTEEKTPRTVKCPACSSDVSSQAYTCPKCGQPLNKSHNPAEKTYQRIKWFTVGVGLLIFLFLIRGCPVVVVQ